MAKKEFSWDTEELLKEVVTEKDKYEFKKCTGFGKTYIVIVTWYMSKEGWKFKKNNTIPKEVFDLAADAVAGHDIW